MRIRRWILPTVLSVGLASCGGSSMGAELPSTEDWTAANPQPSAGVPFHLVVDLAVGDAFRGEAVEVAVDGEVVVEGVGHANPEKHCNWYGPYVLVLETGPHDFEVKMGDGLTLVEQVEVEGESHGVVTYWHPSYDGELSRARLVMSTGEGPTGCD